MRFQRFARPSGNRDISSAGYRKLIEMTKESKLRKLTCQDNSIDDIKAVAIASALPRRSAEHIVRLQRISLNHKENLSPLNAAT